MAILVFFPMLRASRAVNRMRIMNSLILLQYVPRIYPIYRDCKNLNKKKLDNYISDLERKTWVPGLLNFILYILASHVFGAFWYFFSIQRQIECWGYGCQSGNGCEFRIFDCDDGTLRNVTLLNDLCPVNPSNAKVFDFGIYLDALQSGMLGSTDFSRKGLAVFLLGHTKSKATNKEYWILLKMWKMRSEIELMSNAYGLSNADWAIWYIVRRQFRRDEDLAVENIFSILPITVQDIIKRHKEVPRLQRMDQKVLDAILKDIEQVIYDGGNYIIREGEPLDMMIFISRGSVLTYNTTSTGHGGGGC